MTTKTTFSPTPADLATMAARKRELARKRVLEARRRDARQHGYYGPLTRTEVARAVSAA